MEKGNAGTPLQPLLLMLMMLLIVVVGMPGLTPMNTYKQNPSEPCRICKCNGTIVNCSDRGLTNETIPKDIPSDTKTLYLSGNNLGSLGIGLFTNLTKLEVLVLFNSSITHLSNGTFDGLTNLQELNISCNEPLSLTSESTPAGLFIPLKNLKVLKMYGNVGTYDNNNTYIDKQLSPLTNLEELWVDGFTQNQFGKAYRNLTSLKSLRITDARIHKGSPTSDFCQIKNVSATFLENLIHVQNLTIRNCGIELIDKKAFDKLQNLQYLDISKNNHLNLANAFKSLCGLTDSNLKILTMNNMVSHQRRTCGITLTVDMAKCLQNKSLQELHLDYNRINFIEYNALEHLPKSLKTITAEGNEFELGFYIFQTFKLTNVTSISIPYQGYTSDISIWRLGAKHNDDTRDFHYPKSTAKSGNFDLDNAIYAEDGKLQSDDDGESGALDEHMFSKTDYLKHILERNRYATKRDEIEPIRAVKVCPQYNTGKYIPPRTVTAYLPPLLTSIDLSHSRIGSPIFEIYVNESNSLKSINASYSMLYCWDGPVHGLINLEYLDLSHNFCEDVSSRIFEGLTNLKYLNMSYNFLGSAICRDEEGKILENLVNLRTLVLNVNDIFKIPRVFFKSLVSLEELNLRGNSLETFDVEISHMTKLRYLNLQSNRIKTLSQHTRDMFDAIAATPGSNKTSKGLCIDLRFNSVRCYCNDNVMDFIEWTLRNYNMKCNHSLTVRLSMCHFFNDQKVANFSTREEFSTVLDDLKDSCRSYTEIIVCVSVVLAVIINMIIAVIVHRKRWRLQYWYYVVLRGYTCSRKHQSRQGYIEIRDNPEYYYDVYVASCEDQCEFIVDKLRIEFKRHSLCSFLQVMHIRPGLSVPRVIANSIHRSQVIVFILSDGWSNDDEMVTAYQMWRHDKRRRDASFAIGVKLGKLHDDDIRDICKIQADAFLDYPEDVNEQDVSAFWTTLVHTIQSHSNSAAGVDSRRDSTNNVIVQ